VFCHGVGFPELDLRSANGKLSTNCSKAFEPASWAAWKDVKPLPSQLHAQRRLSPINIPPKEVVSIAFAIDMNMKTSVI
jgi:hypothetical protein